MGKPHPDRANRIIGVVLALMLAVTMLPAAGLQAAYADEPVERPATSGGDVALESTNGEAAAGASQAPVAEAREDGMLAAGGLVYTVADGGLALAGFDGEAPEGALAVPAAIMVDGKETAVVAVDVAEGQVADKVVVLSLSQGIKDIDTGSLAAAFPSLLSVEAAAAAGSSLPAAAGAASMRAAYSASGGMLFRPATVEALNEDGSVEIIECKELVWAPPALTVARIPVECRAIAEGAFADVKALATIVTFGTMERISDGAFSTEQMEAAKVVVPQASAAVTDAERVSASMALMGDAGQKERRSAWHEAGWRTDDIVMGKPYGSLTETVAVTDDGAIERIEMQLVSYPGAHENAMDLKKPNADGVVEQAESGLAFTVKSDMTASVAWQGDKTATPAHVDIPASVAIDEVTYPVTEIAAGAFEGAAFLTSVTIPEGVTTIGDSAFANCTNLTDASFPTTLKTVGVTAFDGAQVEAPVLIAPAAVRIPAATSDGASGVAGEESAPAQGDASTLADSDGLSAPDALSGAEGEETSLGDDGLLSFDDDSVVPFSFSKATSRGVYIQLYAGTNRLPKQAGYVTSENMIKKNIGSGYAYFYPNTNANYTKYWRCWIKGHELTVASFKEDWTLLSSVTLERPSGYEFVSASFDIAEHMYATLDYQPLYVTCARAEAVGTAELALSGHQHKASDINSGTFGTSRLEDSAVTSVKLGPNSVTSAKIKDGEVATADLASSSVTNVKLANNSVTSAKIADGTIATGDLANSSVTSAKIADGTIATADLANGAVTADKLSDTYARESQFGSIKYEGLEGCANAGVFPTSYYAGHCPAIPEPVRPGYEFLGWTWHGNDSPTTDAQLMATTGGDLFAYPADRVLTANWERETSSADYFFSNSPLDATSSASQTSRIAVSLANEPRTLTRLGFVKNDPNNLFPDYAVWVTVYGGDGYIAGDNYFTDVPLKQLDDGTYGIELEVSLGDGAVNSSSLLTSKGPGSYVADFVTMNYTFA